VRPSRRAPVLRVCSGLSSRALDRLLTPVQVTQQAHLGTVMDHLVEHVQHPRHSGPFGVGTADSSDLLPQVRVSDLREIFVAVGACYGDGDSGRLGRRRERPSLPARVRAEA
jgi:hypothetical protein